MPERLGKMRASLLREDWEPLRNVARDLASLSENLGARSLSALCLQVIEAGEKEGRADVGYLLDCIEAEFAKVREFINQRTVKRYPALGTDSM